MCGDLCRRFRINQKFQMSLKIIKVKPSPRSLDNHPHRTLHNNPLGSTAAIPDDMQSTARARVDIVLIPKDAVVAA